MSIVIIKVIVVFYLSNGNGVSYIWYLHKIVYYYFRALFDFLARPLQIFLKKERK